MPDITIERVRADQKEILRNLLEKYDYEFSQYDGRDVNALGLYGYDWLDCYWTYKNRFAYFIKVDEHLAGFMMINDYPEAEGTKLDWDMAEFFVMYKYRRMGVGSYAAAWAFANHRGAWQLKRNARNLPSLTFWDKAVAAASGGDYVLKKDYPGAQYDDGTPGDIYFFRT